MPDPRAILDETGALPRELPGDRSAGETSEQPTPQGAPPPDDVPAVPTMQDRRKPK